MQSLAYILRWKALALRLCCCAQLFEPFMTATWTKQVQAFICIHSMQYSNFGSSQQAFKRFPKLHYALVPTQNSSGRRMLIATIK